MFSKEWHVLNKEGPDDSIISVFAIAIKDQCHVKLTATN